MPRYRVIYNQIETTLQRTYIEADSPEEAVRIVEDYEHDNTNDEYVKPLLCEFDNVRIEEIDG